MKVITGQSLIASPTEAKKLMASLAKAEARGLVAERQENNTFLMATFHGTGTITDKWNVKVYIHNRKKGGHSIVCNDEKVLRAIYNERWNEFEIPDLPVINFDDSGWGFPLCGIMVGASDEKQVFTDVVPVEYFRGDTFQEQRYLTEYAMRGISLLDRFGAYPHTHRIEICTGFVNIRLKNTLRTMNYDVRVVEIKGLLQDELEQRFREYVVSEVNSDIYYDPKDMNKDNIPKTYAEALAYGQKKCPHLIKNGWKAIREQELNKTNEASKPGILIAKPV